METELLHFDKMVSVRARWVWFIFLFATPLAGDKLPKGAVRRIGSSALRHEVGIGAAAISPDCRMLATGDWDGNVHLWDLRTRRRIRTTRIGQPVNGLAFHPKGRWLAIVGRQVYRWQLSAPFRRVAVRPHPADLDGLVLFGARGDQLILAGGKGISLLDSGGLRRIHLSGSIEHLFLQDQNRLLVSSQKMPSVTQVDLTTGRQTTLLKKGGLQAPLVAARDGKWLVAVNSFSGSMLLGPARKPLATFKRAWSARAFSPDGKRLLVECTYVGGPDHRKMVLVDTSSGKIVQRWRRPAGWSLAGAVLGTGGRTVVLYERHGISFRGSKRWFGGTDQPYTPLSDLVFSPCGRWLAGAGSGAVWLFDVGSGSLKKRWEPASYSAIAFSPDGARLAAVGSHGSLDLLEVATGQTRRVTPERDVRVRGGPSPGTGSLRWLTTEKLCLARPDGRLEQWSPDGGQHGMNRFQDKWDGTGPFWKKPINVSGNNSVSGGAGHSTMSPDGRFAALPRGRSMLIAPLGLQTRRGVSIPISSMVIIEATFSSDGRWFAVLTREAFDLYDSATGRKQLSLKPPKAAQWRGTAFSADTQLLALSDNQRRIHLYELTTGRSVVTHTASSLALNLAFSPDGRTLATSQADTTLMIWKTWPAPTCSKDTSVLWKSLDNRDPLKVYPALAALEKRGEGVLEKLEIVLGKSLSVPSKAELQIGRLGRSSWEIRRRARAALEAMGERAVPALEAALAGAKTLELRRQLQSLLDREALQVTDPELLRRLRMLVLLSRIGGKRAWAVLKSASKPPYHRRVRRSAQALLVALRRRGQ